MNEQARRQKNKFDLLSSALGSGLNKRREMLRHRALPKSHMRDTIHRINCNKYRLDRGTLSLFLDATFIENAGNSFPSKMEFEICAEAVMHAISKRGGTEGVYRPSAFACNTWNSHMRRLRSGSTSSTTSAKNGTGTSRTNDYKPHGGNDTSAPEAGRAASWSLKSSQESMKNQSIVNPWERKRKENEETTKMTTTAIHAEKEDPFPPLLSPVVPCHKKEETHQEPATTTHGACCHEENEEKTRKTASTDDRTVFTMLRLALRACELDTSRKQLFLHELLCRSSATPLERSVLQIAYDEAERCVTCLLFQGFADPMVDYFVKEGETRGMVLELIREMLVDVACVLQELATSDTRKEETLCKVDDVTIRLINTINDGQEAMHAMAACVRKASVIV